MLSFDDVDSVHISEITASLINHYLGINSSDYYTNNSNNVVDWEFIPNYVFENGDIGNIIRVYLSDGKSYTVYMQTNGDYSGWDISGTKVDNLGGGCSIFAPSSVLSYMLGIDVFDIRQTIRGAGNFYGLEQLCHGKVAINVDGKNFVLKTDLSEKKEYEGEVLSKDEVLKDWQNTVDAGGVLF